jgi:phage terminase large subunit
MIAEPPARAIYEPHGRIRDLWAYRGREVLVAGPAGTGKSRGALEKLDNLARLYPGMRGLIARKLRTTLTQTALVTFDEKVLGKPQAQAMFHHGDQEYRYPNRSVIAVAGLDDPEKVKSSDYDVVYVQEATELEEDDWAMLIRGLRNGVMPYQQLMADCNPSFPGHWLKMRCDEGACRLIESRHEDNPALWDHAAGRWTDFGREYIAGLDSLKGYLYQRLRLGQWVAAEGMYFEEWNPEVHVVTKSFDPPADWPRWIAVDYGFADPFCCLWFARVPKDGTIYVYRELYASGLRDEQQAELIKQRSFGERLNLRILDPSMFNERREQQRPSIASVYAAVFGPGCPVYPGMNSRKPGWAIVRRALAHDQHPPRLRVMRDRCPNLIRTMPAMVKDPLDPEDLADKISSQKTEDHAVDALRYGLAAEAQPPTQITRAKFG